jgi:glucokinase
MNYYIGIDLGGTNIVAGVVDENYAIIAKRSIPTKLDESFETIVASIANTALEAVAAAALTMSDIKGIGIGTPGSIDKKTNLLLKSNNFGWWKVPFPAEIQKHFPDTPVFIDNDANCAALGEVVAGAAKEYKNAVMLTLGTGVGSGIILDNKIFSGCDNMGAELGQTIIVYDGEVCSCGQKGCLEAYTSATALIRQTKEAIKNNPDSIIHSLCGGDMNNIEAKTVFDAMALGDKTAEKVVEKYISYLAAGVISIINVFRPDVIIIGGGVSNAGDAILKPLNLIISEKACTSKNVGGPPAIIAKLGNDAGLIGAACLAF